MASGLLSMPYRGEHVVHLRQPRAGRQGLGFRDLLAGRDQHVDQEIGHQRRGDEVEHDGRDHDVAAAPGLQPARDERPDPAEQGRGEDRRRHHEDPGQPAEIEGHQRDAQAAEIGLALAADVEQAAVERDGDGEPREDEARGVEQRVADRLLVAEGAEHQQAKRLERVFAEHDDDQPGYQEGRAEVQERQEAQIDPARQLARAPPSEMRPPDGPSPTGSCFVPSVNHKALFKSL